MAAGEVRVNTLRVRGEGQNNPVLRLSLANLLKSADLRPQGMPPAAVLIVRHLDDPQPGALAPYRRALRVKASWERAAQKRLTDLYRSALRPQRGVIRGTGEAVLFTDEVEMVACLALALRRGQAGSQWWWQVALGLLNVHRELAELFIRQSERLPAALGYLVEWDQAAYVLAALTASQALTALKVMLKAHGLPDLLPPDFAIPSIDGADLSAIAPGAAILPVQSWRPLAPWHAWLPSHIIPETLSTQQACLLGVALSLGYRPTALRSPVFRQTLRRWWVARVTPLPARPGEESPPPSDGFQGHATESRAPASAELAVGQGKLPRTQPGQPPVERGAMPGPLPAAMDEDERLLDGKTVEQTVPFKRDSTSVPAVETGMPSALQDDSQEMGQSPSAGLFPGQTWADTHLGGVLYLSNLMRALRLPDCFESTWGLASQVGAWGVLELLGRALLGPAGANFRADPLWRVLAELDSRRSGILPGVDYHLQGDGHLPPGWEALSDGGSWLPAHSPLLEDLNELLLKWLAAVMPSIRQRLFRAMQLSSGERAQLAEILLLRRGRVYVTRSHVDLVMSLDAISLPVRIAGLDANPGWLPQFGRVLAFHFL